MLFVFSGCWGFASNAVDESQSGIYLIKTTPQYAYFTLTVDQARRDEMFLRFVNELSLPVYLVLELPTSATIEATLRTKPTDPYHKDVYYLSGLNHEDCMDLYTEYGSVFDSTGVICYGFGSVQEYDRILMRTPRQISIYTETPDIYMPILDEQGFVKKEHPEVVKIDLTSPRSAPLYGSSAHQLRLMQVLEELQARGLYFVERIEW